MRIAGSTNQRVANGPGRSLTAGFGSRTRCQWSGFRRACESSSSGVAASTPMLWRKLAWMPEKTALRIEVRCAGVVEKDAPSDLPVYPEVPYAFFGFHPGLRRTFHLLDVRYPQVYRTQPLGASRKLSAD